MALVSSKSKLLDITVVSSRSVVSVTMFRFVVCSFSFLMLMFGAIKSCFSISRE